MSDDLSLLTILTWKVYVVQRNEYIIDVVELVTNNNNIITTFFKRNRNFVYNSIIREYVNFYSKNIEYIKLINQLHNNEPIQL